MSEKIKQKISKGCKGISHGKGIQHKNYIRKKLGYKHTDESKNKIRQSIKLYWLNKNKLKD